MSLAKAWVINRTCWFHPNQVAPVALHKLVQQFQHHVVRLVPLINHNAVHILRQTHWTVDLDLPVGGQSSGTTHGDVQTYLLVIRDDV